MTDFTRGSRPHAGVFSRRAFLVGATATLAGCASAQTTLAPTAYAPSTPAVDPVYARIYAAIDTEPFPVPTIDVSKIDPRYFRQVVKLPERIPNEPGTLVVDPARFFLYLVRESSKALRYGVGVGRAGFAWNGRAKIKAKREWPGWYPPKEMIERDPRAAPWANGMPGGPENPLGARALYLYEGDVDTLYRIHGTSETSSIGKAVSSGCIRMFNQDVIDLYGRIPLGTGVIVLPATSHEEPVSMLHEHPPSGRQ